MDQLLTIGALAQRCRLSHSALRFYDQCGPLQPVAIDPATGHPYYQETQVGVAKLVRQLRKAEVPVEDVRAFLAAGTDERRRLLESYRASLRARLVSAQTVLDELESSMTTTEDALHRQMPRVGRGRQPGSRPSAVRRGYERGTPGAGRRLGRGQRRLPATGGVRQLPDGGQGHRPWPSPKMATSAPSSGRRTSSRSKTGYPSAASAN